MDKTTRDATHDDSIARWARYMREHPKEWRKHHNTFIDAQFEKQRQFLRRLAKTSAGKKKIIALYKIKNTAGYPTLLNG